MTLQTIYIKGAEHKSLWYLRQIIRRRFWLHWRETRGAATVSDTLTGTSITSLHICNTISKIVRHKSYTFTV